MKQTAAHLKQSKRNSPLAFLKHRNDSPRFNSPSPRTSLSNTSPDTARGLGSNEVKFTPTSVPDASRDRFQRLQAIRTPLIHLLAIRPLSTKYLTQHIKCSEDDIREVLQKVGKESRLDSSKWDLNDRYFKELDIWKFKYSDQHDRELAIERAVFAFDRMRISQEDPKWQILYPPHERGKGKTLSHLNHLHKGPIQHSNTPRIHVQHPEDASSDSQPKESEKSEGGRLTPSASEPKARSKPQDLLKKMGGATKETKIKRLQSNGPKKAKAATSPKQAHPAVKKGGKKVNAPLSEEFVHDSDEEDGLEETLAPSTPSMLPTTVPKVPLATKSTQPGLKKHVTPDAKKPSKTSSTSSSKVKETDLVRPKKVVTANSPASKAKKGPIEKSPKVNGVKKEESKDMLHTEIRAGPKKVPSSPAYTPGTKQRLSEAQKSNTRQRTLSSPLKPSPLGSSPPTNASEFEQYGPSSPSITPPSSKKSNTPGDSGHINGRTRNIYEAASSTNGYRPITSSSSSSDTPLKRKANDLDSDIHNHSNTLTNGYAKSSKRHRPSTEPTPPESDSSGSPLSEHELAIQEAQRFKTLHAKYAKAYQEVAQHPNPPAERIHKVKRMHQRLAEMKRSITMAVTGR